MPKLSKIKVKTLPKLKECLKSEISKLIGTILEVFQKVVRYDQFSVLIILDAIQWSQ